jgi:surfeit locus 1 family protein
VTTRRRPLRLAIWLGLGGLLTMALLALGIWQVQRRAWKLDLIARVEARLHAAPVAPPPFDRDPAALDYTRVRLTGRFVPGPPTLVQAVTDYGGGFWAMQPLRTDRGTILVNRGFVPPGTAAPPPTGPVSLTGLIRRSEPGGGFLRANDPAANRWYSRDVAAIAAARGIAGPVAPWFVDAAASGPGWPKGGLTVVRFRNNHLVYALTWFALAAMVAGAMAMLIRGERRTDR